MKKQDNELVLWVIICAIIGIFIWQMPNIERLIYGRAKKDKTVVKKDTETENKDDVVVNSGRVTCGMTGENDETIEYQISYTDSKVTKITEIITVSYQTETDEYNNALEVCNNVETSYTGHNGFSATCTNENSKFETKYIYDLQNFAKFTDSNGKVISVDATYNEDLDTVVSRYKSNGATCK